MVSEQPLEGTYKKINYHCNLSHLSHLREVSESVGRDIEHCPCPRLRPLQNLFSVTKYTL